MVSSSRQIPKQTSPSSNIYEQSKLKYLGEKIIENFQIFIDHFDLTLEHTPKMYVGRCPVHGGDKNNAFNIFHSGDSVVGNWYCRTKQCERTFVSSPIGLVRGLLSHHQYSWENQGDKTVSIKETIEFCEKMLSVDYKDVVASDDNNKFASQAKVYNAQRPIPKYRIKRKDIRNTLTMPCEYFLERGFSPKILNDYDVGMSYNPKKGMYYRAVVPVYDDNYNYMVGCTGRTVFEACPRCSAYHNPKSPCPKKEDQWKYSKWKHSAGFDANLYLYNYWFAFHEIYKTGVVIVVESPGNCWRAVEAGYLNIVGTFGAKLSFAQKNLLDRAGAMTVLLMMDGDAAGRKAAATIKEEYSSSFNIIDYQLPDGKDLANLTIEEARAVIKPIMDKYSHEH